MIRLLGQAEKRVGHALCLAIPINNTKGFAMISLIRMFFIMCIALAATQTVYAEVPQFTSGVYETLQLAVGKDGVVTGYFHEELGESRCRFFIKGKTKNGITDIAAWDGSEVRSGELKAEVDNVILKVKGVADLPGCGMVIIPEIENGLGYSLVTKMPWSELRSIVSAKAYFYSEAKADKQLKSYLVKDDVVGLVAIQGEWLQIDYHSPTKGTTTRRWINSRDAAALQSGR